MLTPKLVDALNEQMKFEFFSGYLYMAIAGHFENDDLPGFANWMRIQAKEELAHGQMFFDFICEAGGRTNLQPIDGPKNDFTSTLDAFEYSLEHEKFVTGRINKLMSLAKEEGDHASEIFLQWFVTEQVEEEANFGLMVKKLQRIGDDGAGLLRIDEDLATRVFTPPAALAG
jgi:ferritin